ncbi:MAG: GNAT family N-acetyltransferase, partial [Caldilineaceae bacterium]|nr:GNAT family N-acetyltransferase [Caldilineaceae bacterium]
MQPHAEMIDPNNQAHIAAVAELWNIACGPELSISVAQARQYLISLPESGETQQQSGQLFWRKQQPIGFVLASCLPVRDRLEVSRVGWINGLAVAPACQHQTIGAQLLAWAEQWLADQNCQSIYLGGGQRSFTAGLPVELASSGFFEKQGYGRSSVDPNVWDVAANLATYTPPAVVTEIDGVVRPAQPRDADALQQFLHHESRGSGQHEMEEFLRIGGRLSDYMLLWTSKGVEGCCRLTFQDSPERMERLFPYRLPRPWGHVGEIVVRPARSDPSFRAALLDAALRRLHNNGVNGCMIDRVTQPDWYIDFGFEP